MAGETFIYEGSNRELANPPSSAISPNPSFSGTDNTLLPAGSESDPPTDNDIIIDYATARLRPMRWAAMAMAPLTPGTVLGLWKTTGQD
jgi:hypothetical protein